MRRALLACAVVALVAAACAAPPARSDPALVRVLLADDWASAPVVGEVVDAFERDNPGVTLEIVGSPFSQIPDLVEAAHDAGQPYDVAHWHAFAAAAAGLAEPIDDLWEEAGLHPEEYLPGALEDVSWPQDRRYGVPLDTNALVLMANEAHLRAAGLTEQDLTSLDGFWLAAGELAGRNGVEHAITVSTSSWVAYGWIVAAGGELVEIDGSGQPTFSFDDPSTVAALELLAELISAGHAPPPFAHDLSMDAVATFATGSVSLHASGSWDLPTTRRAAQAGYEIDGVAVLPLPQADPDAPRTVLGGSSLFVPVGATHRELGFELMLALTDDDVALELARQEGRLPARQRVFDDPLFRHSEDLAAFVDQLPHAEVMPLIAYPDVASGFRDALEDVLTHRTSPQEAMQRLQAFAESEVWGS